MVTVFTKNQCGQCDMTKKLLEREGIDYTIRKVDEDDNALMTIKDMGYLQVPVVVTALGDHWSGFRPDLIKTLKKAA